MIKLSLLSHENDYFFLLNYIWQLKSNTKTDTSSNTKWIGFDKEGQQIPIIDLADKGLIDSY